MEYSGPRFAIFVLFLLLWSLPVLSDDEEDHLLQGINSFRQSARVAPLSKHDKADCIADEIADKLEDQNCASNTAAITQTQLMSVYPSVLNKCKVDINTTSDGMILPVCVPHRVPTLVLTNYTHSLNSRYLNNSRFTGVGIGTEEDWTVLVLATSTPGGSFASAGFRVAAGVLVYILLMWFVVLMY